MKKIYILVYQVIFLCFLISCNKKKYTEVVEVPLPSVEEKIAIGKPEDVKADPGSFELEKLDYPYTALAPTISPLSLEVHYSNIYLSYTNNLNKFIENTEFANQSIEDILAAINTNDSNLRNNAGGYYNHRLYWKCMSVTDTARNPADTLSKTIVRDFGNYANLITSLKVEATNQFGSAWTWLIVDKYGKLRITSTQNQDNPLMQNAAIPGIPILAIDLWEHAYYLGHQHRRRTYIDSFFKIVNWKKVNSNYELAITKN